MRCRKLAWDPFPSWVKGAGVALHPRGVQISGETIWRLDTTWANLPWMLQVRLELSSAAEAADSASLVPERSGVKWMQQISQAIWTGSSSCPWLAADASLTAPSFQLPSPWLLLRSAGLEFCRPGFFPSGNYFSFLLTIRTQRKTGEEGISRR